MKLVFLFASFLSLLNASSFRVENSLITYFGVHYLHKWEGSTSDVKGVVSYDKNIDRYDLFMNALKEMALLEASMQRVAKNGRETLRRIVQVTEND